MAVSSENRWMDGLREYMGKCPLYEGFMYEKDTDAPKEPIRFMRQMSQKNYKCKYCNVNRLGQHQDYCPTMVKAEGDHKIPFAVRRNAKVERSIGHERGKERAQDDSQGILAQDNHQGG